MLNRKTIKEKLGSKLYYMPKKYANSILFFSKHGYKMDWKNPKTLDEKMRWLLTYSFGRKEAYFADKYKVREYIESCGYGYMLTTLLGVWKSTKQVNREALPDKFILKTNHAAGPEFYAICTDKAKFDWDSKMAMLESSLHTNYANRYCEYHYAYIKPYLLAEELLDDGREERMTDYKVHCFHGKPHCVEIITSRSSGLKTDYYSLDWKDLGYTLPAERSNRVHEKPQSLEMMIQAAEDLSKPFPYARIDFYDVGGKPYVGEITLCPSGGNNYELNENAQYELGELLMLPSRAEILKKKIFGYTVEGKRSR